MKKNIYSFFTVVLGFTIIILGISFVSQSFSAENNNIIIPQKLHSGDVLSALEWNKVRQALIDLKNKTGEINIGKDGKMGIGLNGKEPEEDLHIKGTTYADANILLEDGEAQPHKWSIGGGEFFYIAKIIGDLAHDKDRKDTLKDGISIEYDSLNVGIRNHDPKASLHIVKGDKPITGRVYSPSKTVIIENSRNERTRNYPNEEDAENNILSFITHDKRGQAGVQFATGENDGWHGWLGFFNEIEHKKLQFFDKDSDERHIMLSANGPNEFQKSVKNSFFVNSGGNAGMGTDKPFHKFHIFESPNEIQPEISDPRFNHQTSFVSETQQGDANIGIAVNNNTGTSRIQFSDNDLVDGNNKWDGVIEYLHENDDLSFSTQGIEYRMFLNKHGYLGLGPELEKIKSKFHVQCNEREGFLCSGSLGLFENTIPKGSAEVIISAESIQALFLSNLTGSRAGSLVNDIEAGKMILKKGSGQEESDQTLFRKDDQTGEDILLADSSITLTDEGYIGVNNTDPKHVLHILGGFSDTGGHPSDPRTGKNAILAIENKASNANIAIISPRASGIQFSDNDGGGEGDMPWDGLITYKHEDSKMSFGTNSINHRMVINEDGWVGINKETPEHGVHFVPEDEIMKLEGQLGVNKEPDFDVDATSVNGDKLCVGGDCIGSWAELIGKLDLSTGSHTPPATCDCGGGGGGNTNDGDFGSTGDDGSFGTSDKRLKTNITPLTNILEKIQQINGVSYNWKKFTNKGPQREIGVIAQDVEKVFPELVTETQDGFKAVFYSKMVAVLLEGIKAQQIQIETLENRLILLESRLDAAGF